jgi:hypothetical protein
MANPSFEDWVRDFTVPCIARFGPRLLQLDLSWDTFARPAEQIVDDLMRAGFPDGDSSNVIVARDVVCVAIQARQEQLRQMETPLAVFWDMENVHIPRGRQAESIVATVKAKLKQFGTLKVLRAYGSVPLVFGTSNEQVSSDLQLSGVHLVHTPHLNRKEVADKMIIVDAMQFAYENLGGAAVCFITGDTDYAYLFSQLQRNPRWSTILISKGTMRTMLHANATATLRWETDILGITDSSPPPPPAQPACAGSPTWVSVCPVVPSVADAAVPSVAPRVEAAVAALQQPHHGAPSARVTAAVPNPVPFQGSPTEQFNDLAPEIVSRALSFMDNCTEPGDNDRDDLETLTENEAQQDDLFLLLTIIRSLQTRHGRDDVLKSEVGADLRQKNPVRFPDRLSVQETLARAIRQNRVIETGEGATKRLRPANDVREPNEDPTLVSEPPRDIVADMPIAVFTAARDRPFVFVGPNSIIGSLGNSPAASLCIIEENKASRTAYLMCRTYTDAARLYRSMQILRDPSVSLLDLTRTQPTLPKRPLPPHEARTFLLSLLREKRGPCHWATVADLMARQGYLAIRQQVVSDAVRDGLVSKSLSPSGHEVLALASTK